MKRSKRLQRVSELGAHETRRAGRQLAAAQQARADVEQLLSQLQSYRQEYLEVFQRQSAEGMDAVRYGNFQRFFDQLDRAIAEQERALACSDQQLEHHRTAWLDQRRGDEILSKLTGRLAVDEYRQNDKREQKEADDHSSQRHKRRG